MPQNIGLKLAISDGEILKTECYLLYIQIRYTPGMVSSMNKLFQNGNAHTKKNDDKVNLLPAIAPPA